MRKIWKKVLIFLAITVVITTLVFIFINITPQPPVKKMELARESLSKAKINKADIYSKKLFNQAKSLYDSAMVNWERENKRFYFFRNYDKVSMFAELSVKKADQASENSISNSTNLKTNLKKKLDTLNNLVAEIDELFTTYPLTSEVRSRISKGKLLLEEAEIAYKKGQYLQANRKTTDSEYLLTASYDNASSNLKSYFKSYSTWKRWVERTISDSRKNNSYAIIIDKFSRKFFVYLSGVKKYEFDAELGKNWVGDKRVKGDKATPEGMYMITNKFEGSKTKYHKALLLNYPNEEDRVRFRSEIERGTLPRWAKIGGLIEIHGDGGKGVDWTEGCVALTDREIDIVYKIVSVGTPVTIIGSMVDLQNIMNR
ncbi:MAG: L,D-transpeptidase family protein [Bacteroidales bacterium]|nr:L,D-transpeptidase family protein [Bacteroidales bacterium]